MTYRERIKSRREVTSNAVSVMREVSLHIAYFISGFVVSIGAVLSELSPFGASFIAAVPFMYMPAGMLGTVIGFLIKNPVDCFRYIAVVISIGALRWVLNEFKKVSQSRFFPSVIAFVPVFLTSLALTFSGTSELTEFSMCLMEATLSAAGAYFMSRTVFLFSGKKSLFSLSQQEIACIAMSGCILLLALSGVTISYVSVGRIAAMLIILLASRYGGVSGGCICAVTTGIVFSLASKDMMFLCVGFAFSGLMGGLFAPMGKVAVVVSMVICNLTLSFSSSDSEIIFAVFIETVIASVVFLLLPKSIGNYIVNIFSAKSGDADNEALRRAVTMRLSFASKALSNVSSCVTAVSDKLSRMYSENVDWVYNTASVQTCTKCGMRYYCFDKCRELTTKDFHTLTDVLKENGFVKEADITERFEKKCCRAHELAESINQSYKEFLSCEAAKRRVTQVRSVVAGQFSGLSDILLDLSEEFCEYERYDSDCSDRVAQAMSSMFLPVVDCSCRISKGVGMVVELEFIATAKNDISKSAITREVSKICGRRFSSAQLSFEGDRIRVTMSELSRFDLEIGSAQHICKNNALCGDCLTYFNNGMGSIALLLSDGMGTGSSAAVDSNMAISIMSKLLKAGLSYDCALQVVNSSLMIKSEDETLATLDVADFNTFTGKMKLLKAGACVTYIRKGSKLYKKDTSGLPIGILNEVKFAKEDITLRDGDIMLMISDGALVDDDTWIEKLFMNFYDKPIGELATMVVDEAIKRRNGGHDDDITALSVRVIENQ